MAAQTLLCCGSALAPPRQLAVVRQGLGVGLVCAPQKTPHRASPCPLRQVLGKRNSGLHAFGGDNEATPVKDMSSEQACAVLQVRKEASFDEVLRAKKRLSANFQGDEQKVREVEAAYDVLLMASMKRRFKGEGISQTVKFADERKPSRGPKTVLGLVTVQQPNSNALATQSAIFLVLAGWSFLQVHAFTAAAFKSILEGKGVEGEVQPGGVTEPPGSLDSGAPALQLGLSGFAAVYFLRSERRVSNVRSAGLALGAAVVGAVIGGGLNSWLRPDIVPIAGISNPSVFVSEFAILSLWATSLFLS